MAWGIDEAAETGVNEDRFRALVDDVDTAPDLATLYTLLQRGLIGEGDFREGAKKGTIEDKWLDGLLALRQRILSPAEAANAFVQGYMEEAEAEAEAALSGVNARRSQIQRDTTGLPPGPMDGLTLLRRGIITEDEYRQLVREGHTKLKYVEPLLGLRNRILTASQWATAWLKGHATEAEAKAGGALEGYDADAMDLLYLNQGRPATVRQIHIGYARGAKLPGAVNEEAAIRTAVRQSNVRTEYADLLVAQRYTYPSPFVLRALVTDGTFSEADGRQILIESGWRPEFAEKAAAKWAGAGTAGPSAKWADRARTRVFTEAWNDFQDGNSDETELRGLLAAVGAVGGEQDTIVQLATTTRDLQRRDLTQAQILKLYKRNVWPIERTQAALEDLGMTPEDAADLIAGV